MNALLLVALTILGLAFVWFLVLPWAWKAPTKPDDHQDECLRDTELRTSSLSPSGVVKTIRLTDEGEFADRCELAEAIYETRNHNEPEIIVWYVHGWKHNAGNSDPDLIQFKALTRELAAKQEQLPVPDRRRVVGIYIGWDGAVGPPLRLLRNLTFWDRMRAADRISQSAILTKIISSVKYARLQKGPVITSRDLQIMIGHSFGARILFTATSQVLLDKIQGSHPGIIGSSYQEMAGQAHLILLLNPAFEASVFTAIHSIRRPETKKWEKINERQQPLLLALTTKNDWATRAAFPTGQLMDGARTKRRFTALGHYNDYITHYLSIVESSKGHQTSCFWYDRFKSGDLILSRTAENHPGNPFIVAGTTSEVIDGHNGIWGHGLRNWLVAFLLEMETRRTGAEGRAESLVAGPPT